MNNDFRKAGIKNVQEKLKKNNLDAVLVTTPANLSYLFGYSEEGCFAIVSQQAACFFAPLLYFPEAQTVVEKVMFLGKQKINRYLKLSKINKLSFEARNISYNNYQCWQRNCAPVQLLPTENFVEEFRLSKNQEELTLLREAAAIADKVYSLIVRFIKSGRTELQVAQKIEELIRREEAEPAFKPIVAGGLNAASPHHLNSTRELRNEEMVILDFGAKYCGYNSDLTRTVFLGKMNEKFRRNYEICLAAQLKGIEALTAGANSSSVDYAARRVIAGHGLGKYFVHSTGHGLGLEVHESPRLAKKEKQKLLPGMVITVEPGIYIPGWGGIRIEDMVEVTVTGPRVLTKAGK